MSEEQRKEYLEVMTMIEAYCSGYLSDPGAYLELLKEKMKAYKTKWNLP